MNFLYIFLIKIIWAEVTSCDTKISSQALFEVCLGVCHIYSCHQLTAVLKFYSSRPFCNPDSLRFLGFSQFFSGLLLQSVQALHACTAEVLFHFVLVFSFHFAFSCLLSFSFLPLFILFHPFFCHSLNDRLLLFIFCGRLECGWKWVFWSPDSAPSWADPLCLSVSTGAFLDSWFLFHTVRKLPFIHIFMSKKQ